MTKKQVEEINKLIKKFEKQMNKALTTGNGKDYDQCVLAIQLLERKLELAEQS